MSSSPISLPELVQELITRTRSPSGKQRVVLFMYGPPGSGKTTTARALVDALNAQHQHDTKDDLVVKIDDLHMANKRNVIGAGGEETKICIYNDDTNQGTSKSKLHPPYAVHLKMDGFHLPRRMLSAEMEKRRGCYESFDADLVVKLSQLLLEDTPSWDLISIPDFDHKMKDPVNPGTFIHKNTQIIVFEGLYLMLDIYPWSQIHEIVERVKQKEFESSTSVKVVRINGGSCEEMEARVAKRHLQSGLVESYQQGVDKYKANDRINAQVVQENSVSHLDDWVVHTKTGK